MEEYSDDDIKFEETLLRYEDPLPIDPPLEKSFLQDPLKKKRKS